MKLSLFKQFQHVVGETLLVGRRHRGKECHYPATRFLQMIDKQGAVPAAKTLLAKGGVSSGFTELWERRRLDLTVETLILEEPWSGLFTAEELRTARQRLDELEGKS